MTNKNKQSLALAILLSGTTALTAQTINKPYEIYPTPQHISYNNQSFTLTPEINIVYEKGIDAYTKKRLEKILKTHKLKHTTSNKINAEKTNILVGINQSGGVVDAHFNKNVPHKEDFFKKTDSHIVSVNQQIIGVLGTDTDSAFYGITTLKHIFNQLKKHQIHSFRIDDFAHVKHRGFIEGYYGNPWSNEDRADLMRFGGDYKLNTYFFAPKDDIYHNKKWRELYPEKELKEIKKLAKVGNETKNKYVYALHPFMYNPVRFDTEENYQNDLTIIKKKFVQLLENDVRAFSILADDAAVPPQGPQTYVRLLKEMTAWLKEQKKQYPDLITDIVFCPNDYMGNGSSKQLRVVNQAPASISIIMTGGRIWGEVSQNFTTNFKKNISSPGFEGRPAYLWINWPCTDNSKKHLIMGGNDTFLHPKVNPENIDGIILNPMQQAEPNKHALFSIADYGWNIWDNKKQAAQNWHDSFKYMNHGTAEETKASTALRTISQHMINQDMDGRVRALQESVELAPKLDRFKEKLKTGTVTKTDTEELIKEFEHLKKAAAYYKKNSGNPRTRDQIIYWLNCWEDTTTAAIHYLHCINAVLEGKEDAIWTHFSTAHTAFEKSKTYKFWYIDHYQRAQVGVQHIVPFIKTMGQHLNGVVTGIIDPNKIIKTYTSNRADKPSGNLKSLHDNNATSGILYQKPNHINKGEFIGITYNNDKKIHHIQFQLGTKANPRDTFSEAEIQITKDGKNWQSLNGTRYTLPQEIIVKDLNIKVRGVRLIATKEKQNTWLGVRGIHINQEQKPSKKTASASIYTNNQQLKQTLKTKSSLANSSIEPTKNITLAPKEYIGIKLDRIKDIEKLALDVKAKAKEVQLQSSCNGIEWQTLKASQKLPDARYLRFINTTNRATTLSIHQFEVHSKEIFPLSFQKGHAKFYRNYTGEKAFDGDFSSTVIFEKGLSKGDVIQYNLGQEIEVNNLKYIVFDTESDHIRAAKFQLSLDGKNWKDAIHFESKTENPEAKPQDNGYKHGSLSNGVVPISHAYLEGKNLNIKARYLRILATKNYHHRWVRISEIMINDGAYQRPINNPTYSNQPIEQKGHGVEKMFDSDLTSSFRPSYSSKHKGKKSGFVTAKISENTKIDQINIVQSGTAISQATVSVRTEGQQWHKIGTLDKSLNQLSTKKHKHIFEIKIEWENAEPVFYEMAFKYSQ